MEKKLVQRCETEVDGDACKASYLLNYAQLAGLPIQIYLSWGNKLSTHKQKITSKPQKQQKQKKLS